GQDSQNAPQLTVTMAFQSSRYTPGTSSDPTATIQAAASAAAKFVQAYNQLQQGDLIIRYRTSMDQTSMTDTGRETGNPYLIDKATFVPFVAHALLFTGAMGALTPFQHMAADAETVQDLVTAYDTSASDLFAANKDVPKDLLFNDSLTVPIQVSVRPQESLNDIISDAAQAGYSVTVDDLAQLNAAVPLATGVALTTPTARSYSTTGTEKLQDLTASLSCSIAGIVAANDKPGVLATGFVFTVDGNGYTVQSGDTFTTIAAAFDSQFHVTVTTTALATLNQAQPGIFAPSVALTVPDVVVQSGQSLTSLQTQYGFAVADMATDNAAVPGIFAESTLLLVTTRSYSGDMTLAEVASQYQLSVDALGEANLTAAFKDGALVTVPGRVLCNQTLPWPYRAAGTETIATLAAGLGLQSLDLLALSQDLPGIFPSGLSISVGKGTVTTNADSTFAGMLASLQPQDSTVTAAALAGALETKIVTAGALIIFPPMAAGSAQSLQALSQRLNLSVADLAAANQNLQGFLQEGATLAYPATAGPNQWTYQTKATDTLAAILDACNAFLTTHGQAAIALSDLANANATVAMVAQASAVLPAAPDPVTINQAVKADLSDTLFALVVNLELDRLENLVDPDFSGVTPVYQSVTTLSPQGANDGSSSASLQPFAESFEAAFPGLKVATGQGISETDSTSDRPLWVVDFADAGSSGPTPINYQLQTDGVAYYAVPPISNTLWGDTVQVPGYVSGQGLTADQSTTFQSVDLDVWGRTFLEAVDLFLSPTYAVPAYQMDATNTAAVISAKETLGDAIAAHMTDLFNTTSNADRLRAAQEILKQNLLVQLSQAYSVNTVVQYPVSVTSSPYTDPVTAARLSGKVTTASYTTGAKDTLTTLADWVTAKANIDAGQVSVGYIAEMIAGLPGILAVGQVVLYGGAPYTITSSDTLTSVAAAFQVPVTTLATGLQLQNSAMGLFTPATTISISVLSRTTLTGDTFEVLAAYFDCALQDVGLANAQVPGLIPAGTYTINGQSVVLSANQTLEQIAAQAGTTADQIPLYLPLTALSTGVVLYAIQAGQALSLTTAKVELAQGSDATLTFLVSARSPGASRSLTLDLDYVVNSLEVPTGAPDQKGYQPSEWLSFILPFDETEHTSSQIGQVEIPIPLRAYPDLPVMLQQDAAFTYTPPTTVDQLRRWTYTFAFNFSSSAQDQPTLTVVMNQAPSVSMAGAEYSLPEALARFISVWPALKPDLALLPQLSPGTANAHASNAIPAFATLVGDVATAWQNWVESANGGSGGGTSYSGMVYNFTVAQFSGNDGSFQDLLLTLSAAPDADSDGKALGWPDISIMVQGEPVVLDKKPTVSQPPTCTYSYPAGSPSVQTQDVSEWHFAFGPGADTGEGADAGLDLGTFQNAWAGLSVTRNANLLSNAAMVTNPIFVYATPVVGFADKLVPYLATDSVILFNQGTTADLTTALPALLTALAGGAIGQAPAVGVAARYGYQLQPPVTGGLYRTPSGSTADEMIPLLPILISPPTADIATLGTSMAGAIQYWYSQNSLADMQGAGYYFAVNLYSSVDPDNPQPLLKAGRLYYMLTG
ncbi:MAG TPA: LysM peptidoglycan-binding domain-containing protein, partial [Symbiobacteriaceae bacterium]|nr:LysM peptidoglycan-binding domain-containing protein [Symbiobacteriaceae bacterium]